MLAFTAENGWEPGIGDPTLMGWLTVAAYFSAALLCWRAAWTEAKASGSFLGGVWFWAFLGAGLALLGINKQLDLQTWFTFVGKRIAQRSGWYEDRRLVQVVFIAGIVLGGGIVLVSLVKLAGRITRPMLIALAGATFLVCFVIIRAASFHHVDQMLGMNLGGLKVNWILELGSILFVATGAFLNRPDQKTLKTPS